MSASDLASDPRIWGGIMFGVLLLAALLVSLFFTRVVHRITRSTQTRIDDILAEHLRRPVSLSLILAGLWYALSTWTLPDPVPYVLRGVIATVAVLLWTIASVRIVGAVLDLLADKSDEHPVISPRTLPVFDFGARAVVYGGAVYFVFLAWNVDLTAWLASAGIVGIAVGFAARDTLANLFAGVFILADAPYKLGDYLILDTGERGRVTEIGIRATRLLTRDDVEIIVPNAVMANAKIINQSGGPREPYRVRATVEVAYGSDIDQVRALLLSTVEGLEGVIDEPHPRVRFREFGASGLRFQLMAWVAEPMLRGRVLDQMNSRIYKTLGAHDIEIPYSKHDVYLYDRSPPPAPDTSAPTG